ncbi:MAG: hypothetical protein PUB10_00415 [Clostridiales bacterium]|nr:hypothetical protein [Clostridiales bacterium]
MNIIKKITSWLSAGEQEEEKTTESSIKIQLVEDTKRETHMPDKKSFEECCYFIKEAGEQIKESDKCIAGLKEEYGILTEHLSDIQKIQNAPKEDRDYLADMARRIVTLEQERTRYQNRQVRLNQQQIQTLSRYEEDLSKDVKRMRDNEEYQLRLKSDMRYLEEEKTRLHKLEVEIRDKQTFLNKLSVLLLGMVLFLLLVIAFVMVTYEKDIRIPLLLTGALALFASVMMVWEARKNRYDMTMVKQKQNKAIALLNTAKLKYVNITNAIDYANARYGVTGAQELDYLCGEYRRAKEEERSYTQNSQILTDSTNRYVKALQRLSLKNPDDWIYQAEAMYNEPEMEAIRCALDAQRQEILDQITYNTDLREKCRLEVEKVIKDRPELKEVMDNVLDK